jgi:hypothetical protein
MPELDFFTDLPSICWCVTHLSALDTSKITNSSKSCIPCSVGNAGFLAIFGWLESAITHLDGSQLASYIQLGIRMKLSS